MMGVGSLQSGCLGKSIPAGPGADNVKAGRGAGSAQRFRD